jgi:hypothetical protein
MLFNATPDVWLIEQLPPVGSWLTYIIIDDDPVLPVEAIVAEYWTVQLTAFGKEVKRLFWRVNAVFVPWFILIIMICKLLVVLRKLFCFF